MEFASSRDDDSPVLPDLLDQIPEGACDTCRCHTALIDRQAIQIIPFRKNGRP